MPCQPSHQRQRNGENPISYVSLVMRLRDAMANIMREENGGDLTYFLEYYLELLSRAVDERRLRMSKKEEENRVAEQEMAHTPLSAPIATTGRDPEPTVGEVREEEENPTAEGSAESAPEWQELIGTDPPTLPREEQNKSNVERLQADRK